MKEQFGDRLFKLRKDAGLTQDEFVEQINSRYEAGLNKSIISRYENNIHKPSKFALVQQIADFFGVTEDYLVGLSDEKFKGTAKDDELKRIPVLGTITSNQPLLTYQESNEYTMDKNIDFCLKIKDDSMVGARIFEGDLAFIQKQPDIEHGEIAVVIISDKAATLKRIYKYGSKVILHSENPTIPDMTFTKTDKTFTIIGKVKYVRFEAR